MPKYWPELLTRGMREIAKQEHQVLDELAESAAVRG
jgi:hypothetical protein